MSDMQCSVKPSRAPAGPSDPDPVAFNTNEDKNEVKFTKEPSPGRGTGIDLVIAGLLPDLPESQLKADPCWV